MVLAAGAGKRLRPVTLRTPKALVPVRGKPLLQWALDKLGRAGANPIYVNVHHQAAFVRVFLDQYETAEEVRVVEEDPVLETGGGIRNVARLMEENDDPGALLVHNADVLSSLSLDRFEEAFEAGGYDALLAVQKRETSRPLAIDSAGLLAGRFGDEPVRAGDEHAGDENAGDEHASAGDRLAPVGYSGILMITGECARDLPGEGPFPLVDALLALVARGAKVGTHDMSDAFWTDVGTLERWLAVEHAVESGGVAPEALA